MTSDPSHCFSIVLYNDRLRSNATTRCIGPRSGSTAPNTASDKGARRNSDLPQRRRQATGGRSGALAHRGQPGLSQERQVPSIARNGDAFPRSKRMKESHNVVGSPSRRRLIKAALAGLAAPAVLRMGTAFAAYPDRPVKIVVANTPGGPSDIMARFMAAAMQEAMGASVVVENKGGGGGNIGMGYVARADADGYTILLSTSAYAVNPGLYNTPPYDPFKDFVAVCELAVSPHVFAVKPDLGAGTMKEFVPLAKADPEKFNVSTPPIGTTPQLQAEVLKLREGLQKMATIPFPGGGDALKALLSGTVQLSSGVLAPAHPQIKAGTIKGLA